MNFQLYTNPNPYLAQRMIPSLYGGSALVGHVGRAWNSMCHVMPRFSHEQSQYVTTSSSKHKIIHKERIVQN